MSARTLAQIASAIEISSKASKAVVLAAVKLMRVVVLKRALSLRCSSFSATQMLKRLFSL
jgi:hypothetical protein